jgi:hypothetical protein
VQQGAEPGPVDAALGEPGLGRLVAGRGDDVGSGADEVQVALDDGGGVL